MYSCGVFILSTCSLKSLCRRFWTFKTINVCCCPHPNQIRPNKEWFQSNVTIRRLAEGNIDQVPEKPEIFWHFFRG